MSHPLLYPLALSKIPGIGDVRAKTLIEVCGSAEAVFRERPGVLQQIPRAGSLAARALSRAGSYLHESEQELKAMDRWGIAGLYYQAEAYPRRLKHCEDGPLVLFIRGSVECLNKDRMLAVVGSRKMTDYGREQCKRLIEGLAATGITVVSGLAYGVDGCAHRAALDGGLQTLAVMGHGLDRVYPRLHSRLARQMMEAGGALLSEFCTGTLPDREHFPRRNRIIAGLSDALVVIEAAKTGGALITARLANDYHRDVFALPGRVSDVYSQGCNLLIRSHKAHLIESAADLCYIMDWAACADPPLVRRTALLNTLEGPERQVMDCLLANPGAGTDRIIRLTGLGAGVVSGLLLGLECKGLVRLLPGNTYGVHGL